MNKLEDFNFLFLLYSYHGIFTVTDILYKKLQKVGLDLGWSSATIESALSQLKDLEDNRFDDIYDSKVDVDPPTNRIWKRSTRLTDYIHKVPAGDNITLNHRERYKELYTEILKETRSCIKNRFGNINELKFCKLLNYEKYAIFNSKDNFPDDVLTDLKNSVYGSLFDTESLKGDLRYLYGGTLPEKLGDLAKEIYQFELHEQLPQVSKLVNLALTIPLTVCSAERSFSALKRIKTRLRNTMGDKRLSDLAVIAIEIRLVETLDIEIIIDRFAASKDRRIDLTLRK